MDASAVADLLREFYESFATGDARPLLKFLAADVVYHLPGKHLGGGTLRSRAAVLERMASAASSCTATPRIELIDVVAASTFVISIERFSAQRAGHKLDQEACVIWRMHNGQCVEIWSHFEDQAGCDAFWAAGGSE